MGSIHVEPLIPAALWAALAVASAGLLGWYAWRRPGAVPRRRWAAVVGLMSLVLAVALFILLNPTWVREIPPPAGKPVLTVLVDASGSMATPDEAGRPRYEAASKAAARLAEQLGGQFEVRVRTFAEEAVSADPNDLAKRQPTGKETDLAAGLASSLAEDRPLGQAVVVLSDGIHNAGGGVGRVLDAVRSAKASSAPLFTRTLGSDVGGFDLAVQPRSPQDLAFVGQKVAVTARVTHPGLAGGRANVTLLRDGQEVGSEQADLRADLPTDVQFWVTQEKVGVYPYELRVEPLPGEVTQGNNAAAYLLRVVDQPIRVLQLEGKPYWDSKFLQRTLTAVPAVELDSVVRVAEGRYIRRATKRQAPATVREGEAPAEPRPAAPPGAANGGAVSAGASPSPAPAAETSKSETWNVLTNPADVLGAADALKDYQIVVLGRDAEAFLNDEAVTKLQQWVSRDGGSLVCYRGSPTVQANERLSRLLPVKWTAASEGRFRMKLTDDGRGMQWLAGSTPGAAVGGPEVLANLPTLAAAAQPGKTKPLAVVLATAVAPSQPGAVGGEMVPAVVYQPYGSGRVVVVEGAGMWRWAFLPPQYKAQEDVYASLWHSMVRWLISGANLLPGQDMTLRADKVSFATGEPATVTLLVREEALKGKVPAVELRAVAKDGRAGEARAVAPAPLGDQPGTYRASFGKLEEGRYAVQIAGAGGQDAFTRTVFEVKALGEEQLNLRARPDLMARIAADSGGAVLATADGDEVAGKFKEHMARVRPPRYERTTAWDRWWVLLLVFGLWGASWAVRRMAGLV
jgi:hypothetical protein